MLRAALCLACLPAASGAETAMTSAEFEAWSTGKTLEYDVDGRHKGSEMHLAGRATVNAHVGKACRSGHWYPSGNLICFVYDTNPGPHCWRFLKVGDQVFAKFAGDDEPQRISVTLSTARNPCDPGVGL